MTPSFRTALTVALGVLVLSPAVALADPARFSAVTPVPERHGNADGVIMQMYRGGHALPPTPRSLRVVSLGVVARVEAWRWVTNYTPIPRAPRGCRVRYGQNNAAAKRMGLVSVTWDCPDSVDLGVHEVGS